MRGSLASLAFERINGRDARSNSRHAENRWPDVSINLGKVATEVSMASTQEYHALEAQAGPRECSLESNERRTCTRPPLFLAKSFGTSQAREQAIRRDQRHDAWWERESRQHLHPCARKIVPACHHGNRACAEFNIYFISWIENFRKRKSHVSKFGTGGEVIHADG